MRIGDVARRTGIPTRMLRYYEQRGLMAPVRRENGYREYGEDDVRRAVLVRDLVRSGVPTRLTGFVLDREYGDLDWTAACDEILAGMVREQIADLDSRIACLSASRDALAQLLTEAAEAAGP